MVITKKQLVPRLLKQVRLTAIDDKLSYTCNICKQPISRPRAGDTLDSLLITALTHLESERCLAWKNRRLSKTEKEKRLKRLSESFPSQDSHAKVL